MEGNGTWMPQLGVQSIVGDAQSTWDPAWKNEEFFPTQIERNEDSRIGKTENLATSIETESVQTDRNEALRIALNKLAEDSGSDMDIGDSSDDSLSSADSDEASKVITTLPPSSSRRTRLFQDSAAFDSPHDFFNRCQQLLFAQYGYRTNKYQDGANFKIAACSMRKKGCRFSVRVEEHDGVWFPNFDKTEWQHNHDSALLRSPKLSQGFESGSENGSDSSSGSEEEPLAKQIAGTYLSWKTDAESKRFLSIFSKRETIFARQRSLVSSQRQQTSEKLVAIELENLPIPDGLSLPIYSYEHSRYLEFAKAASIPPYPVTYPLIALYLSYRGSLARGTLASSRAWLNRLYRLLADDWENDATYSKLERMDDAEEGIREYIRERSTSRVRPPKDNSAASQAAARNVESESEAESFGSDNSDYYNGRSRRRRDSQSSSLSDTSDEESPSKLSSDEASDSENHNEGREASASQRRSHHGARKPPTFGETMIPGMPKVGQFFSSTSEAYKLCSCLNLLAIGINVILMESGSDSYRIRCARYHFRYANDSPGCCDFYIRLSPEGDGWIVSADSIFVHNHKAAPERKIDPNWMPKILNPLAREALGLTRLPEKPDRHSLKKRKLNDSKQQKQSVQLQGSKTGKERKREKQKAKKKEKRQREAKERRQQAERDRITTNVHNSLALRPPHQHNSSSTLVHQPQVSQQLPRPPLPVQPYATLTPSNLSQAVPRAPLVPRIDSQSFLPSLSAFLRSLHPSLTSFAQPLLDNGIDTLDTLGAFVSFETSTLQRFTDELRKKHQLSNIHITLLRQTLAAARASQ